MNSGPETGSRRVGVIRSLKVGCTTNGEKSHQLRQVLLGREQKWPWKHHVKSIEPIGSLGWSEKWMTSCPGARLSSRCDQWANGSGVRSLQQGIFFKKKHGVAVWYHMVPVSPGNPSGPRCWTLGVWSFGASTCGFFRGQAMNNTFTSCYQQDGGSYGFLWTFREKIKVDKCLSFYTVRVPILSLTHNTVFTDVSHWSLLGFGSVDFCMKPNMSGWSSWVDLVHHETGPSRRLLLSVRYFRCFMCKMVF